MNGEDSKCCRTSNSLVGLEGVWLCWHRGILNLRWKRVDSYSVHGTAAESTWLLLKFVMEWVGWSRIISCLSRSSPSSSPPYWSSWEEGQGIEGGGRETRKGGKQEERGRDKEGRERGAVAIMHNNDLTHGNACILWTSWWQATLSDKIKGRFSTLSPVRVSVLYPGRPIFGAMYLSILTNKPQLEATCTRICTLSVYSGEPYLLLQQMRHPKVPLGWQLYGELMHMSAKEKLTRWVDCYTQTHKLAVV